MFCTNCGKPLEEKSAYCHHCGHRIKKRLVPERIVVSKRVLMIGLGIFAVLVGGYATYAFIYTGGGSPQGTSQNSQPSVPAGHVLAEATTTLSLSSLNPTSVIAPYQNIIAISGTGFKDGATVKAGNITLGVNGAVVADLLYVNYSGNLPAGTYDITVINPDGSSSTLKNALTIQAAAKSVSAATVAAPQELTSAQITAHLTPSVVLIRTEDGCGSGMVVRSDGIILTDDHVINGEYSITVYLSNGSSFSGSIVSENTVQDLALIKINQTGLSPVTFGDSSNDSLALGSDVTALGYPLTCNYDQTLEVDPGIVTARRSSSVLGDDAIQTSARINPGDSGGPLVDDHGSVVGINESIFTIENLDFNVTGIAFATPSNVLKAFVNGTSYSASSASQAGTGSFAPPATPGNPREFTVGGQGFCVNNPGVSSVILSGYPLVEDASIPSDDIMNWSETQVTFIVPSSVPAGIYQVMVRGYDYSSGLCGGIHTGSITVQ